MFQSMAELIGRAEREGRAIWEVVLAEEVEDSARPAEAVIARLGDRLETMRQAVERGLATDLPSVSGLLGGGARRFEAWRSEGGSVTGPFIGRVIANAQATMEVNARMGTIVATPTAGSSGILPAILFAAQAELG